MAPTRARDATLTVVAVVASALCVAAGIWQGQRTSDAIDLESASLAVPISVLDAADESGFPALSVGRQAFATGEYRPGQVLVGPREFDGRSGWWVLTPLSTQGATVAVLRGWVDAEDSPALTEPIGQVAVSGTLQPFEEFYADRPRGVDGQLVVVSRPEIQKAWGGEVVSLVLVLGEQNPASQPAPLPVPATVVSGGAPFPWQNAAYTLQWFVFAVFVWVMWWMWVVRDRRVDADADSLGA